MLDSLHACEDTLMKVEAQLSEALDLLRQAREAFVAVPSAPASRKMLKKLGVVPAAYAGNRSHLLAGQMVKEIDGFLGKVES